MIIAPFFTFSSVSSVSSSNTLVRAEFANNGELTKALILMFNSRQKFSIGRDPGGNAHTFMVKFINSALTSSTVQRV